MIEDKQRDGTADLLKGTAVVLMIQVHIMELFAQQAILDSWVGEISLFLGGPPVAPVFMAVMGYFAGRPTKSARSQVFRGLKLVVLGFVLNLGLNCHLFLKIQSGELQVSPWEYVFGVDILILAGLSLIVIGLLRPLFGSHPGSWGLAAVVVVLLTPVANDALTAQDARKWVYACVAGEYWWSYFPLFPWLAYPLLGASVRLWKEQPIHDNTVWRTAGRSRSTNVVSWVLLGLVLTLTVPRVIAITHDLPRYYHHDGWPFLWFCVFLLLWVRLFHLADRHLGRFWPARWLKWMGRHITVLYVLQWLIIGNTATAIYKTQGMAGCMAWGASVLGAANLLAWMWLELSARREGLSF